MRAFELRAWSLDSLTLTERPEVAPGRGQIRLRMLAASINARDLVMMEGGYGRRAGRLPLIPLSDGAGLVEEVGEDVDGLSVGSLVCPAFGQGWTTGTFQEHHWSGLLGGPLDGTACEQMIVDAAGVVEAPNWMSAVQAAALPCAAVTAWNAMVEQTRLLPGDTVVVQGTGGVATFCLQFAVLLGLVPIVVSSSDAKLAAAAELGANHLINYTETPHWWRDVLEITNGTGADMIIELGGAATIENSTRAVRASGTICLIGVLGGGHAKVELGRLVTRNVRIQSVTAGSREMFERMVRVIDFGEVHPVIDEHMFEFEELPSALEYFRSADHRGKVCLDYTGSVGVGR